MSSKLVRHRPRERREFKAFVSHASVNAPFALRLAKDVEIAGRRWWQRRTCRVFLSDRDLAHGADLSQKLRAALANSEYLLLLASPAATASHWVKEETEEWIRIHGHRAAAEQTLIAVVEGELNWTPPAPLPAEATQILPSAIVDLFEHAKPAVWADFRTIADDENYGLQSNAQYRRSVSRLAGQLLGKSPRAITETILRDHRIRRGVIFALVTLTITLVALGAVAFEVNRQRLAHRYASLAFQGGSPETALEQAVDYGLRSLSIRNTQSGVEALSAVLASEPRIRQIRNYHRQSALAVDISQDGNLLATSGKDGVVNLYANTRQGFKHAGKLHPHDLAIHDILFIPQSPHLAVPGSEQELLLYDTQDLRIKGSLRCNAEIHHHRLSVDSRGRVLASAGAGLCLWSLPAGEPIGLPDLPREINNVQVSPDGTRIAFASGRDICLLSLPQGALPHCFEADSIVVTALAFSPDARSLAFSGSGSRLVEILHFETWKRKPLPGLHTGSVTHIAFSPLGDLVGSACWDSVLRIWDLSHTDDAPPLTELHGHRSAPFGLAFHPLQKDTLVSADGEGRLVEWTLRPQSRVGRVLGCRENYIGPKTIGISGLALVANKLVVGLTGRLESWQSSRREAITAPSIHRIGRIEQLATNSMGELAGAGEGGWFLLTRDGKESVFETCSDGSRCGNARAVAFHPNGATVAVGWESGVLELCDISAQGSNVSCKPTDLETEEDIMYLDYHPGGIVLAVGEESGRVSLFGMDLPCDATFYKHRSYVTGLTFSNDGRFLFSTGNDGALIQTDLRRNCARTMLFEHPKGIGAVVPLAEDSLLLFGTADGSIRRISFPDGELRGPPLLGHVYPVRTLIVDRASSTLYSAGNNGCVIEWDLASFDREWHDVATVWREGDSLQLTLP